MKKSISLCLLLAGTILLTGCSQKFEPTQSTIFVTSKGTVKSAIMESFEEEYYNFEELKNDVEKMVQDYCKETSENAIVVESFTEENDAVTLMMQYETVQDYNDFNDMVLFSGTLLEAEDAGYIPGELYDIEGQMVSLNEEEKGALKVIVTEESISIQTSGKIKCVSDNVTILDSKLAKALEAGVEHPAFVVYK